MKYLLIGILMLLSLWVGTWIGYDVGVATTAACAANVLKEQNDKAISERVAQCAHRSDLEAIRSYKHGLH